MLICGSYLDEHVLTPQTLSHKYCPILVYACGGISFVVTQVYCPSFVVNSYFEFGLFHVSVMCQSSPVTKGGKAPNAHGDLTR